MAERGSYVDAAVRGTGPPDARTWRSLAEEQLASPFAAPGDKAAIAAQLLLVEAIEALRCELTRDDRARTFGRSILSRPGPTNRDVPDWAVVASVVLKWPSMGVFAPEIRFAEDSTMGQRKAVAAAVQDLLERLEREGVT